MAFSIGITLRFKHYFYFILGIVTLSTRNLIYIAVVPFIYLLGYGKLKYLFNLSDEGFYKRMEKQLEFYRKKNEKSRGEYVFQMEKILFEVELKKLKVKKAIRNIEELLSVRPNMKRRQWNTTKYI